MRRRVAVAGLVAPGCFGVVVGCNAMWGLGELRFDAIGDSGTGGDAGASGDGGAKNGATSYLSPAGPPPQWGGFARAIAWTMASEEPSTIRFTIDGSEPGPASPGGVSPFTLQGASDTTVLRWLADNGVLEPAHTSTITIKTGLQAEAACVVENVLLDGVGPVVVRSAGAVVDVQADYQIWSRPSCPSCIDQIVYGIDSTAFGCLFHGIPGTWPGATGKGAFAVTVPSEPGLHRIRVAYTLQYSCPEAVALEPFEIGSASFDVGVVVVR